MAWYDRFIGRTTEDLEEKNNPSQYLMSREEGFSINSREVVTRYRDAYEKLEVVNRAVNIVVDDVAEIPVDGRKIQGWIGKPPNFNKNIKYPLIVENHGGPISNYGDRFSPEILLYSASGYVVFLGYKVLFCQLI